MTRSTYAFGVLIAVMAATPEVQAQQTTAQIDLRVGKLEKEMRAVQRTVFPQGAPVQAELAAPAVPATAAGSPASSPVADLTSRVDGLERQIATLTGASEQTGFKVKQLEDALAKIQARLTALEGSGTAAPAAATPALGGPSPSQVAASGDTTRLAAATPKPAAPKPVAVAATPKVDPARKAAVAAVEAPSTGDAIEDLYSYGFRLYTAKFYPEAQAKLKEFTAKHPVTQKRWSYAQNLLGRAYLDEGKPALASVAFYDNYQKAPRGERAAESLTWLGQSLIKLKKPADACKVFAELNDVYGTKLTADQKARAAKGRADAKCAA